MYGFTAYSSSGQLLVSSEYFGYHLLNGITSNGTIVQFGYTWNQYYVYYPYDEAPIIMIDMDVNDTAAVSAFNRVGDDWHFRVLGTVKANIAKIKPFGKVVGIPSSTHGILVKDSASKITFSSASTPLWITDTYSNYSAVSLSGPNFDQINGTLSYTNTNPIFMCNMIFSIYNAFQQEFTCLGIKRTGTNTWSTCAVASGSTALVTVRNVGVIVGDLV